MRRPRSPPPCGPALSVKVIQIEKTTTAPKGRGMGAGALTGIIGGVVVGAVALAGLVWRWKGGAAKANHSADILATVRA
jgi:hypothetical protein